MSGFIALILAALVTWAIVGFLVERRIQSDRIWAWRVSWHVVAIVALLIGLFLGATP